MTDRSLASLLRRLTIGGDDVLVKCRVDQGRDHWYVTHHGAQGFTGASAPTLPQAVERLNARTFALR